MKLKKFFLAIFTLFLLITGNNNFSYANNINKIQVVANIQDNGTLNVTQVWNVNSTTGTEYYIPMQNLNHMTITDFTVTDNNGRQFTNVGNWNIDWPFNQKAYKNGINRISGGIELNFGKSDYNITSYTLNYNMTNAVQSFSDMDGFNIRFINSDMSPAPKDIEIIIQKDGINLNSENAEIWAFGFSGEINFIDGKIVAKNSSTFTSSNNATIMVGLEKGLIQPTYLGTGTFEDLKNRAFEGSDYGSSKSTSFLSTLTDFILRFIGFLIIIPMFLMGLLNKIPSKKTPKNINEINFKKIGYYSDLPAHNNLVLIYYLISFSKNHKADIKNLIAAYFLKWVHDGAMTVTKITESKRLIFKSTIETVNLQIVASPKITSNTEQILWQIVNAAAGSNKALEEKEFEKYVQIHYSAFEKFIKSADSEDAELSQNYNLTKTELTRFSTKFLITDTGKKELENIVGFYNYLRDFTLIKERSTEEVLLWDNYLIIATLFDMGDKVMKEMQKLYPEYTFNNGNYQTGNMSAMDFYILLSAMRNISNAGHAGYISSQTPRSVGFGGGSSLGGGGGFSGGGFGGGSR